MLGTKRSNIRNNEGGTSPLPKRMPGGQSGAWGKRSVRSSRPGPHPDETSSSPPCVAEPRRCGTLMWGRCGTGPKAKGFQITKCSPSVDQWCAATIACLHVCLICLIPPACKFHGLGMTECEAYQRWEGIGRQKGAEW